MSQICILLRLKRPFRHLQSTQYQHDKSPDIGRIPTRTRGARPRARTKTGTAYLTRPGTVAVGRGTPKHGNMQQVRPKAVAFVGFVCPSPRTRPGPGTGPAQPISGAHHVYIERESRWFRQIRLSWKQMNIPQGCVLQETPPPVGYQWHPHGVLQPKTTAFHTRLHTRPPSTREPKCRSHEQRPNGYNRKQRLWTCTCTCTSISLRHGPEPNSQNTHIETVGFDRGAPKHGTCGPRPAEASHVRKTEIRNLPNPPPRICLPGRQRRPGPACKLAHMATIPSKGGIT